MNSHRKARVALLTIALLALLAAIISGYLAVNSQEVIAGCGQEAGDCDSVLSSSWSRFSGLSVAWLGAACYATMLAGSLLVLIKIDLGWRLLEFACPAAFIAAVWFVGLQITVLHSYCPYCLAIHTCGAICFTLSWIARYDAWQEEVASNLLSGMMTNQGEVETNNEVIAIPSKLGIASFLSCLASVGLITTQLIISEPTTKIVNLGDLPVDLEFESLELPTDINTSSATEQPVKSSSNKVEAKRFKRDGKRIISFLEGRLSLDTYQHPIVGDPEAEFVMAEIMDYTCPHCREFHELIHKAVEQYEGKLAVIVLPYAGELLCNPYIKVARPKSRGACRAAKLALCISLVKPEAFERFHNMMMEGERPPSYVSALTDARKMVDQDELSLALNNREDYLQRKLEQNIKLFASMQEKVSLNLPMQILGDQIATGKPETLDAFYKLLEENLGLEPPAVELPF